MAHSSKIAHPKVTVFVPVYNGERFLSETIESVLDQTFLDFELLIVDDCSTDKSLSVVEKFNDPRIRVERNSQNMGRPITRNLGLKLARGNYIAVLDADDVCELTRLETEVRFLDCHPQIVAVGSAATFIDETGKSLFVAQFPTDPDVIRSRLFLSNCFLHSSVMFRREVVRSIGGYDENFPVSQDYDLFLRLSGHFRLANLSEPLVRYRIHGAQVSQEKLATQRKLADLARSAAYEAQRKQGLIPDDVTPPDFSILSRLLGRPGTLGSDCLYWARVNRALGDYSTADRFVRRALLNSPLSARAWRVARRSAVKRIAPVRAGNLLKWYLSRTRSLFR